MSDHAMPDPTDPRHPIQLVARRTGLSADVIRIWERRYRAVTPRRTDSARRLYSDDDIERLILLRRATQAGRRISDVASLSMAFLSAIAKEDHRAQGKAGQTAPEHYHSALQAIRAMDAAALESALRTAAAAVSLPILLDEIIAPLIHTIGEEWAKGSLRVGHEHLATAQLVALLSELRRTSNMTQGGPKLLIATPAGQSHELGAMLAAVAASAEGWAPVYLSPNAPTSDIAAAVRQTDAGVLALSIIYPADDPHLADELRHLRQQLPENMTILVGGRAAPAYRGVLDEIGAVSIDALSEFRRVLGGLRQTL